ncbi:threonine/homoserine/homoserine lactone efflux protein [Neobacillus niacini]|nr:threonine/homoserine/homoserine lactone efflux protein [Neobacillus niacini]
MLNILKSSFKFIVFLLIFFIISTIFVFIAYLINPKYVDYVILIILNTFIIIFFYYSLIYSNNKKQNNKILYNWIDRLDGSDSFIIKILDNAEVKENLLENLEFVYKKLLVYSEHDVTKLRLLKGYFKSLNNEAPFDLFGKVFLTFLFGVFATNLSNGNIINYFTRVTSHEIDVSQIFQTVVNLSMLIIMFLIGIVFIIRDIFANKKRTKIIEEILDVCIKELESKK